MKWLPWLTAAVAVALPCLPLKLIGPASLARVRDYFLLLMLMLGGVWLAVVGSPFAPLAVFFLHWWPTTDGQGRTRTPSIAVWVALVGLWLALGQLSPVQWTVLGWGWAITCVGAVGYLAHGWWWMGHHLHDIAATLTPGSGMPTPAQLHGGRPWWHPYRPLHTAAWFGQRTSAAAFCALTLPFFPIYWMPIPVLGLAITSSWTSILAANAALVVLYPWTWWIPVAGWTLVVLILRYRPEWMNFTPRGGSLDPVWQRLAVYRLVTPALGRREWWPWGYGPRSMERGVNRIAVVHDAILASPIHAEGLHFLFEYGLCGLVALLWLYALVLPHLRWGDPWTACWVAGIVCALGGSPFRSIQLGGLWLAVNVKLAGGL